MATNLLACLLDESSRVWPPRARKELPPAPRDVLARYDTPGAQGTRPGRMEGCRGAGELSGPAAGSEPPCERSRRALRLASPSGAFLRPFKSQGPAHTPPSPPRAAGGAAPPGCAGADPTPLPLCATIQGPVGLELTYQNDHRDAEVSRKHGVRGKSCVEPWRQGASSAADAVRSRSGQIVQ